MKNYGILLLILTNLQIYAQGFQSKDFKNIKPDKEYSNIANIPYYNDSKMSIFIIFIKKQVPKHYHKSHTETVFILDGKAEMYLGGEIFNIKKGDQIVIPSGVHHSVVVKGRKPLKVVSVQAPYFDNTDRYLVK